MYKWQNVGTHVDRRKFREQMRDKDWSNWIVTDKAHNWKSTLWHWTKQNCTTVAINGDPQL
jgi:hypothetical protein